MKQRGFQMELSMRNRLLKAKTLGKFAELGRSTDGIKEEILTYIEAFAAKEEKARESAELTWEEMDLKPGAELVLAGEICSAGMDFLARFETERLRQRLPLFFIERGYCSGETELPESLAKLPRWYVGEGGMYRALNELAKASGRGFTVDYTAVPVSQTAIEFCEVFDLDPWQLASGCWILAAERGSDVVRAFAEAGGKAAVIGRITGDRDKAICHRETRSLLNRPQPDELLKVLKGRLPEAFGSEEDASL